MKLHFTKILSLMLMLTMAISLVSCDKSQDERQFPYRYKVSTDAHENLKTGDILTVTVNILSEDLGWNNVTVSLQQYAGMKTEGDDSPFEIIGASELNTKDFDKSGEYVDLVFKVKINDTINHDMDLPQAIGIKIDCHCIPGFIKSDMCVLDKYNKSKIEKSDLPDYYKELLLDSHMSDIDVEGLYLIADTQGVFVSDDFNWDDSDITDVADVMITSLNREYDAGVPIEDLIDRIVKYRLTYELADEIEDFNSTNENYVGKDGQGITYISESMRVKVYLPVNYKENGDFSEDKSKKEILEAIMLKLYENQMISEEEYNVRINELNVFSPNIIVIPGTTASTNGEFVIIALPTLDTSNLDFEIPEGDEFYNYILDLSNTQ